MNLVTDKRHQQKIICMDFDGVIHSYKSGWKGMTNIPDPPVEGVFKFMVALFWQGYDIAVFSSRSRSWFGRRAMKRYIIKHMYLQCIKADTDKTTEDTDAWRWSIINDHSSMDPWEDHVSDAVTKFVNKTISFPKHKPAAILTIDDRAFVFRGGFPSMRFIDEFKPWNKKEKNVILTK